MLRKIYMASWDIFRFLIIYMPGALGRKLRYLYYKKRFKECGRNVIIDEGVIIQNMQWISVGNNVWLDKYSILSAGPAKFSKRDVVKNKANTSIGKIKEGELIIGSHCHVGAYNILQAHGGVRIGNNVTTSAFVKIYSLSNIPSDPENPEQITYAHYMVEEDKKVVYVIGPVEIDGGAWVGLDSIILPGSKIGKNSFVQSKSLVCSCVKENSVVGGNPAKFIKKRFIDYE